MNELRHFHSNDNRNRTVTDINIKITLTFISLSKEYCLSFEAAGSFGLACCCVMCVLPLIVTLLHNSTAQGSQNNGSVMCTCLWRLEHSSYAVMSFEWPRYHVTSDCVNTPNVATRDSALHCAQCTCLQHLEPSSSLCNEIMWEVPAWCITGIVYL